MTAICRICGAKILVCRHNRLICDPCQKQKREIYDKAISIFHRLMHSDKEVKEKVWAIMKKEPYANRKIFDWNFVEE